MDLFGGRRADPLQPSSLSTAAAPASLTSAPGSAARPSVLSLEQQLEATAVLVIYLGENTGRPAIQKNLSRTELCGRDLDQSPLTSPGAHLVQRLSPGKATSPGRWRFLAAVVSGRAGASAREVMQVSAADLVVPARPGGMCSRVLLHDSNQVLISGANTGVGKSRPLFHGHP